MVMIDNLLVIMITLMPISAIFPLITGVYSFFYNEKLHSYLRKNKPRRWAELLNYQTFTEATSNPIKGFHTMLRMFNYIYNDLDVRDKKIRNYKNKIRFGLKLFLISMAFVFILIFITVVYAWYSGGLSYSGGSG